MDHKFLCEIGAKFLKRPESSNGHGCHFAIIEPSCYGENPDVFGIRHGAIGTAEYSGRIYEHGWDVGTVLLEAKTSRADFLADRKKPHRIDPTSGMGRWRYFICPTDLIKVEELPEKWGLIYVNSRGHCKIMAGAMAVPKQRDNSGWNGAARYWRNGNDLKASFERHTFAERNFQNEMNLITMALARMGEPEEVLYKLRKFHRQETEIHELNLQLKEARRRLRKYEKGENEDGDSTLGCIKVLEDLNRNVDNA